MKSVIQTEQLPSRRILSRMGLIKGQKGILNRYFRESEGWKKHLEETRQFILHSAENKETGVTAILGSGWLLDVPLEELSERFVEVHLYDLHHPPQIRKKAEAYPNVKLIQTDLTGGTIRQAYEAVKKFRKGGEKILLNALANQPFRFVHPPDFIVSVNTLNQLNILITDYMRKKKAYTNKELLQLDGKIQQNHLDTMIPGKSCIITDFEEELYDQEGEWIGTNPLVYVNLPEGNFRRQWQWKFDTQMRYREEAQTFLNVTAVDL